MFGYIIVNEPELKIKEYYEYRSYYCGLCKALHEISGIKGQLSLNYDMTFLALMLSALYEPIESEKLCRCIVHPAVQKTVKKNEMIDYAAAMNLLLTWYKCKDDVQDERKLVKLIYGKSIQKKVSYISKQYARQGQHVRKCMDELAIMEQKGNNDIDDLSGCFGNMLSEIFAVRGDEWEKSLRKIGFFMGKFVYIMDSYEDMENDRKKGCFNPFSEKENEPGFDKWIKQLLQMTAIEFAAEFERLPILENVEILRNIIYSGVWTRYEAIRSQRGKTDPRQMGK